MQLTFRDSRQKRVFRLLQHVVTSIFSKCVILYKEMLHQWRNVAAGKTGVRALGSMCLIKPDKSPGTAITALDPCLIRQTRGQGQ